MRTENLYPISKLIGWWKGKTSNMKRAKVSSARDRLTAFLNQEKITYRLIPHPKAYSALRLAESIHIPGREVAKVVIVRQREEYGMVVLPAHRDLDLVRFAQAVGVERVSLINEQELKEIFPDCEIGAMPPFGNLYQLPVYIDQALTKEPVIFFPAGNHHEVIEIGYEDFKRLVQPITGHFALEPLRRASGA